MDEELLESESTEETDHDGFEEDADNDEEEELLALRQAVLDGQEDEEDEEEEESAEEESTDEEPEPDVQTEAFKSEENARNAERRRQNEQRMLDKLKSESPEFLLSQQLQAKFGKSAEDLLTDLLEAQMKQEAERQGVPYEFMKEQSADKQRIFELEQRQQFAEFTMWTNQVEAEKTALKTEFPMLTDADLDEAKRYITGVLQNTTVPLKQAALALYGDKIIKGLRSSERNEALAQVSGRKAKSMAPPKSGKSNAGETLTAEEAYAAKVMGVSEKDYLKYKV